MTIPTTRLAGLLVALLLGATLQAAEHPVPITRSPADRLVFQPLHDAPATTLSLNDSRIGSRIAGMVQSLPVRVGDRVEAGQVLATLDCRSNRIKQRQAEAALDAARARITLARTQLQRSRTLEKERNIPVETVNQREADLNTARADLASARAALDQARLEVEHCTITAPFTGVVMERLAGEGEWVAPGAPLLRLLDSERLEVSAQIPLHRLASLQRTTATWLQTGQGRYPLRLQRLVPAVDPRGRYREARLLFSERPALPGSSGRLVWRDIRPHLPADLPVRRDGVLGVFLDRDGIARFHPLPGAVEGQPAPSDLPGDALVILDGRWGLRDGDPVEAAP